MYLCVRGIDFVSFYGFCIGFWDCSDSVVFLVFHFNSEITEQIEIILEQCVYNSNGYRSSTTFVDVIDPIPAFDLDWHFALILCVCVTSHVIVLIIALFSVIYQDMSTQEVYDFVGFIGICSKSNLGIVYMY